MNIKNSILEYFELTKNLYEKSTLQSHEFLIKGIFKFIDHVGIKNFKKVNATHGYQLITFLKENTANHNNSINKHIRYLRAVMRHYRIYTDFHDFELLPSDTKPFKRFFHEDLKLIIDYVKNMNFSRNSIVYKTLVLLLLDSGLRRSEAIAVQIKDIDFDRELIYIENTKTKRTRYAPFSLFSRNEIEELIAINPNREYLFYNFIKNRIITKNDVKIFYRRLRKKLNIDRIHTHRFRKTFASILNENGINIVDLQKLLDHKKVTTTMIYVQHEKTKAFNEYKKFNDWKV